MKRAAGTGLKATGVKNHAFPASLALSFDGQGQAHSNPSVTHLSLPLVTFVFLSFTLLLPADGKMH